MPTNKDFKRLVRGRMQKTGESYTSARANLLKKRAQPTGVARRRSTASGVPPASATAPQPAPAAASAASAQPAPADYAKIAGMSDAAVKAKTGCTWDKWVKSLDHVKASEWSHGAIATYIHDKYKVSGWWSQMVAVGYERVRGLRERGQSREGSYEASKSRTVAAPIGKLFKAFSQPGMRAQWLPGVKVTVRKATPNKSIRITWEDGTSVSGWFIAKGKSKSVVQLEHGKVRTRDEANRLKAYWAGRLDALAELLEPAGNGQR